MDQVPSHYLMLLSTWHLPSVCDWAHDPTLTHHRQALSSWNLLDQSYNVCCLGGGIIFVLLGGLLFIIELSRIDMHFNMKYLHMCLFSSFI
jgi:hypothetical protein